MDTINNDFKQMNTILGKILKSQTINAAVIMPVSGNMENLVVAITKAKSFIAEQSLELNSQWHVFDQNPTLYMQAFPTKALQCKRIPNPNACYTTVMMDVQISNVQSAKAALNSALINNLGGLKQLITSAAILKDSYDVANALDSIDDIVQYYQLQYDALIQSYRKIKQHWIQQSKAYQLATLINQTCVYQFNTVEEMCLTGK